MCIKLNYICDVAGMVAYFTYIYIYTVTYRGIQIDLKVACHHMKKELLLCLYCLTPELNISAGLDSRRWVSLTVRCRNWVKLDRMMEKINLSAELSHSEIIFYYGSGG